MVGAVANIEPTLDYPGQGNRRENPTKTHLDRMLLSKTNLWNKNCKDFKQRVSKLSRMLFYLVVFL